MLATKDGVRVGDGQAAAATSGGTMGATSGRNNGTSSLQFHFFPRSKSGAYPHPGGFLKRVWKRLKRNEIAFCEMQKSTQTTGSKGDREGKGRRPAWRGLSQSTRWPNPSHEELRANGSRDFMAHGIMYYCMCQLLNNLLRCNKLRERSNESVKKRKQRGRVHWGGGQSTVDHSTRGALE